jgi:hypothetical protein
MKHKPLYILFALASVLFFSCKKRAYDEAGYINAAYIGASPNFAITTPFSATSPQPLDLSADVATFEADFNEAVTWIVTIKGDSSNAEYTLTGTSKNMVATWNGAFNGVYFFESGDSITATLTILGSKLTQSVRCAVGSVRDYTVSTSPDFVFVPFTNFETGALGSFPRQFTISKAPMSFTEVIRQTEKIAAPEGKYFCRVRGYSPELNGYFVGGVQHRTTSGYFLDNTWSDPSDFYVNLYVRGNENLLPNSKPYAVLNFEFHEDDDAQSTFCDPITGTSPHCPNTEDSWVMKVPINHKGWKLFSAKYSDLQASEDAANGGSGNKVLQPTQIYRVQMGLVSNPPFNTVEVDFDFACFTKHQPYSPAKF